MLDPSSGKFDCDDASLISRYFGTPKPIGFTGLMSEK
jgi:hypothetical protein